ncbi:MAG: hypothetical protein AB1563_03350, partial [Bacillota bacterium]
PEREAVSVDRKVHPDPLAAKLPVHPVHLPSPPLGAGELDMLAWAGSGRLWQSQSISPTGTAPFPERATYDGSNG